MIYKLIMHLIPMPDVFNQPSTQVVFDDIPDPLTADDLVEYFIRFAEACGFAKESIIDAMDEIVMETYPPKKEDDESEQ
jgi:hypothetical protein